MQAYKSPESYQKIDQLLIGALSNMDANRLGYLIAHSLQDRNVHESLGHILGFAISELSKIEEAKQHLQEQEEDPDDFFDEFEDVFDEWEYLPDFEVNPYSLWE